jgi:molybdenum cofactor synthesis domain-containing protein
LTAVLRAAVLTVSTKGARGERQDESGERLAELLRERLQADVFARRVVSDDPEAIQAMVREWQRGDAHLIVLTGGTGLTSRDVTPQALAPLLSYQVPGMAEAMRAEGLKATPHAMLSRSLVGVMGRTLILALPGSPKGASESLEAVLPALPHAIQMLRDQGGDAPAAHQPG